MADHGRKKQVLDTLYGPDGEEVFRDTPVKMYERLVLRDFGEGYKVRRFNREFLITIEEYLELIHGGD